MLRYFRINDPYRLLGLLAFLLLIYLPLFIDTPGLMILELENMLLGSKIREGFVPYGELIDSTGPLMAWLNGLIDFLFERSLLARHISAFVILFLQSVFLGIVFIDKRVFTENSFIPSLIFSIVCFVSFDTITLSGELLGAGFLLLAINNMFKVIEFRTQRDETIFNLGLFISLASLFSFSFIVHLMGALVIMAIFTRSPLRNYLLLFFGFLLPHTLLGCIYFMFNELSSLWHYFYVPNLQFTGESLMSIGNLLILGSIPFAYLLISMVWLNREARFTKYQGQLLQTMFFWTIFSFLQGLFTKDIRPQSFIALAPCFSFFIAHFLLLIRRRKYAELNLWIFIASIVSISFLMRYERMNTGIYSKLYVSAPHPDIQGKRILVLEDDVSYYMNNEPASYLLDWKLTRKILMEPDYYENVILVHEALVNDPPEIIIDREDRIGPFLSKMVLKEIRYVRNGFWYERRAAF